jgi:MbtH protein
MSGSAETTYLVVVNEEDQYSIWAADKAIPLGWRAEGMQGTKEACVHHIDAVWTDMRPKSVRAHQQTQ